MKKNLALAGLLSLALILSGCAIFTPAERQSIADTMRQAHTIVLSIEATAPELVAIGDIAQSDADWLLERTGEVLPIIELAVQIAEGTIAGDAIAQLDTAIQVLRIARDQADKPALAEVLGRVTAGLVFYRSMLVNQI